jgi:hypothetical protein
MKKIAVLVALMMVQEINAKFFLRTSDQVFYKSLIDAAKNSDAKVAYLVMLGCPRLQDACLSKLHTLAGNLFKVKLITDDSFEPWKYPYFAQVLTSEKKDCRRYQSALIMGTHHTPLVSFSAKSYLLTYNFEVIDNPQALELIKQEFDKQWKELKSCR